MKNDFTCSRNVIMELIVLFLMRDGIERGIIQLDSPNSAISTCAVMKKPLNLTSFWGRTRVWCHFHSWMISDGPLIETVSSDCNSQISWAQYPVSTWDFVALIQKCISLLSSNLTLGTPSPSAFCFWICILLMMVCDALIHLGGILRDGMNGILYRPKFNFRTAFAISHTFIPP